MSDGPGGGDRRPSLRRRIRLAFVLVLGAVLVAAVVGTVGFAGVLATRERLLERIDEARIESRSLMAVLVDQETGVRGYALSRDDAFLGPYEEGRKQEARLSEVLDGQVDDVPEVRAELDAARAAAARWHERWAVPTIRAIADRQPTADLQATALEGKALFEDVRSAHAAFDRALAVQSAATRDELDDRTSLLVGALVGVIVVVVGGIGVLWVAYRRTIEDPLRSLGDDARRVAGGDLQHRVAPTGPAELAELGAVVELMRSRVIEELEAATAAGAAVERQAAELARSNTELEQFAYVASHDLQEPLRKVASFCQLLQNRYGGQLDDRADQYIEFAVDGAKRMQALINDLLAFSRVGRTTGPAVRLDADGLVARAIDNLSTAIEETGAEVVHDPLPEVEGDRSLLTALFQNLIGNGIKFRRDDVAPRVSVTVVADEDATDPVPPASATSGPSLGPGPAWRFTVADNGIGIEPEYAERVFVIFQRLHSKERYEGTGIGLALCRKIVEHHGGRIWVDTTVPEGTTIRFTLPRVVTSTGGGPDDPAADATDDLSAVTAGAGHRPTSTSFDGGPA